MNENKNTTVRVRDLTVGMVIDHYGTAREILAIEQGPRMDGRWLTLAPGYRTHRWQRQTVTVLSPN